MCRSRGKELRRKRGRRERRYGGSGENETRKLRREGVIRRKA
jgi:hypothetical protein